MDRMSPRYTFTDARTAPTPTDGQLLTKRTARSSLTQKFHHQQQSLNKTSKAEIIDNPKPSYLEAHLLKRMHPRLG